MKHDLCLRSWRGNLCIFLSLFIYASLNGQAVSINNDGSPPDPASMLDVNSNKKGVLFPRMDEASRLFIPTPPEGLMVWDTTHNSIWGFDGTQWRELSSKWEKVPNGIQSINPDNVGIGNTSSAYSLYIQKPSPSIGFYDDDYPIPSGFIRGDSTAIEIQAFRASQFSSSIPGHLILQTNTIVGGAIPFNAGNVGIGTSTPLDKLSLNGNMGFFTGNVRYGAITDLNGDLSINAKLGVFATPANDIVLQYEDEAFLTSGRVGIGIANPLAKLHVGSQVLIGASATPANGYLLSVDGKVMAEEMRIEDSGAWPDYVFEDGYPLKSLGALRNEINQCGHLPGIPSAAEIDENGILVGEMQKMQMEKIEELTLYILQLHERIEKLEKQIAVKYQASE